MGYDLPFLQKFGLYIKRMVIDQDFGISYVTKQNAFHEIWPRFLVTLKLSFLGVFLSAIIGIPLGIQAAVKQSFGQIAVIVVKNEFVIVQQENE